MRKQQWMKSAFAHAPIGIGMADLNGRWFFVNEAFSELSGYMEDELLAMSFVDMTEPEDLYREAVVLDQLMARKLERYELEKRLIRKNGQALWVSVDVAMHKERRAESPYLLVYVKNIHERKLNELALKESELRYRNLFEHDPDMIYALWQNGSMLVLNHACEQLTGYEPNELVQLNTLLDSSDLERVGRSFDKASKGFPQSYELEFRHKSGHTIGVSVVHTAVVMDEREPVVYGIAKRRSDSPKQSAALKESEERYRLLAEHSVDMICRIAPDGELLYVSPASRTLLGYEPEELIGQSGYLFVHEDDAGPLRTRWQQLDAPADRGVYSYRLVRKDGQAVWIEVASKIIRHELSGEHLETISVFRDMTLQRHREEKLRLSEEMSALVASHAQDLITYTTPDGFFGYVSPSVDRLLGYKPEELIGQHSFALLHRDDISSVLDSQLLHHADVDMFTLRMQHKNGSYVWMESMVKIIRDEEGRLEKVLGIARDITERKMAVDELKEQEERYRQLVEHSPDAVIISSEGEWLYVNDTAVKLFGGFSKEQVMGHSRTFMPGGDLAGDWKQQAPVAAGQPQEPLEQRFVRLDGRVIDVEVKSLATVYQNKPAVYMIVRDVTERKIAQERLQASERLNVAGQLAAGIAHEIRNPLTSLKGFLKVIQPVSSGKEEHFAIMVGEIDRIELIVSELLMLAKPDQGSAIRHLDLAQALRHVITLLEAQALLSGVQLVMKSTAEPMIVQGDENQLKQVFINMIKNAIEAMPHGGEICIEPRRSGGKVCVLITDQGGGIPAECLPRLGEPFFTTKANGTGLGLMVSFKIVEHHGGKIGISSEMGHGTTFDIQLPASG
ncbi:PAS domain S-box protein [Paenibacillus athensensis]|uniref:histidine kinase n=1 Tax=Paenibacillus athensensis TaxID=1967502 RepID=A0A4Y8Q610_9BACL|nr:PAS domain S-box protein [Paenibacillus athensensis]MCD1259863.1 PAS domain S-box protein [Paenibacillus athensensis]